MIAKEKNSRLERFQHSKDALNTMITEMWEDHYIEKSKAKGSEMEQIASKHTLNGISNKILIIQNAINICDEEIGLLSV